MAQKKKTKKKSSLEKSARRIYKKNKNKPVFWIFLAIILFLCVGVVLTVRFTPSLYEKYWPLKDNNSHVELETNEGIVYEDFQIQFLELGNEYAGDSIYVKAGENDILIDAGSRNSSSTILENQIDNYCKDKKLEYVIATHGDQDHISAFVGTKQKDNYNGILYYYDVDNIIYNQRTNKTTDTYKNFVTACNNQAEKGTNITYAHEFFENESNPKDSATIQLSDYVTMTILWNKYYFTNSSDENNYSVCTLFTYSRNNETHNFLLTGDLEKEGEIELARHYDGSTKDLTLPHCDLFKAGHHGSATSSNDELLAKITPSICCVCSCCGTNEYTTDYSTQFITQAFINRIAKYTDCVYCTSVYNNDTGKVESMNGKIIISAGLDNESKVQIGVAASNNLKKLKDSDWFNETIYVKDYKIDSKTGIASGNNSSKKGTNEFYSKDTDGVSSIRRRVWPSN